MFERYSELDSSIIVLNCFLTFYTALGMRQFRHALGILASIQLFPMRPVSRHGELISRIKPLSVEVREEIPRVIFNCLEVHQVLCQRPGCPDTNELVGDMRNLIDYFGTLSYNLKGIETVEEKFKMYQNSIRDVLSKIIIN